MRWSGDDRGGNEKGGRQLRGLLCNASLGKAGSPYITVGSLASYSTHFKIYPVCENCAVLIVTHQGHTSREPK